MNTARAEPAPPPQEQRGESTHASRTGPELTVRLLVGQVTRYVPGSVLPAVAGAASMVVFTRLLDAAEYGRYNLALSGSTLAAAVLGQWLVQGTNRYLPERYDSPGASRLKASIGLGLTAVVAAMAVLGVALAIALWWGSLGPAWLVGGAYVLTGVLAVFGALGAVLQAEMRAGRYSTYQAAMAVARFALSVILVVGVAAEGASLIWGAAVAGILMLPPLWRDSGLPSPLASWHARLTALPECRRLLRYGMPMVGWVLAAILLDAGDRYVIQFIRGPAEVGIYSANYGLVATGVGLLAMPVLLAAHPFLMRAWSAGDPREAARWLGIIAEWFLIAGVILTGLMALFAREAVSLLLGEEFREGYRIVPVVLAGNVAWQLGMYTHKPLEFVGRTRLLFAMAIGTAALNLLLNLAFVPRFGYTAAAYTTLASFVLYTGSTGWVGRSVLPWTVGWTRLGRAVGAAAVGFGVAAWAGGAVEGAWGTGVGFGVSVALTGFTVALVVRWSVLPLLRASRPGGASGSEVQS